MATRSILVFMGAPVIPGCVIGARLIGAIQAKQRNESKGEWIYAAANSSPQRDAGPTRAQKLLAGVKAFRQQKNGHAR
jgi:hypothetical protein